MGFGDADAVTRLRQTNRAEHHLAPGQLTEASVRLEKPCHRTRYPDRVATFAARSNHSKQTVLDSARPEPSRESQSAKLAHLSDE